MNSASKRELAEKIVDLTVMNRFHATAYIDNKPDLEMAEKLRMRMREEQIQLHMKHYVSEQLSALLEFYSTDMGRSILSSQERAAKELSSGARLVGGEIRDGAPTPPFSSLPLDPESKD